ncbi:MAG: hypothetical protein HY291_20005 [Planctomycetes bacterium]|nr:hypothetical protein [Planctomycetota bacterium]
MTGRWLLRALVTAGLLSVGVAAIHFVLGRPDRIAAERRRVQMFEVRDQLLRYESEHGVLPDALDELVGKYVRADELAADGNQFYEYDSKRRHFQQVRGSPVHGLWSYEIPPRAAELPPPEQDYAKLYEATHRKPPPNLPLEEKSDAKTGDVAEPKLPEPPKVEPTGPADLLASSAFEVPKGPDFPEPPADAYVFEAEHFSATNYGWETHADPQASGGAYIHCKEGVANGPGQTNFKMGDFYNERATQDVTFLRYYIKVPKTGDYYVYGRMWTTDTKCSNSVCVAFDEGGPYVGGMENRLPFRWLWSPMKDNPKHLEAGDHFMHVFIHEDGIRFDQFILSPKPIDGGAAFKTNLETGVGTSWRAKSEPPVLLSFDYAGMAFSPKLPPDARVVLRRVREAKGKAALKVVLKKAGKDGGDFVAAEGEVDLAKLPETGALKLAFAGLDLAALPRKEHLLYASLTQDGKVLAEYHTPLLRPWAWELFGPGPYHGADETVRLDGDGEVKEGEKRAWTPFGDANYDTFGVMDFGMQFDQNSQHPRQNATVYARTRIKVPKTGNYLFKIQSDDQMILWVDGKELFRHDGTMPVTRGGDRVVLHLDEGERRMRFRLNQLEGRWQACIRVRNEDDTLSEVVGLEP